MIKHNFFITLLLLSAIQASGSPINRTKAEKIAKEFMVKRCRISAPLTFAKQSAAKAVTNSTEGSVSPYYIFNAKDDNGFVIVSGDDTTEPILGYSESGGIDPDNIPENMKEWLRLNELYVNSLSRRKAGSVTKEKSNSTERTVIVEPLLGNIEWGQDNPFNELCPTYTSGGKAVHYYTGCVATAATQIMGYYNYPEKGIGSKSYTFKGETLSADFGSTDYDWDTMMTYTPDKDATDKQADALSLLAFHFGVAVEMEYNETGSGAASPMVAGALRNFFGYDTAATMRKRDYYNSNEWISIIKKELDAKRPVYYGASSDTGSGGHAFVCDGYDSNDYVHINWGWYGKSNGYFLVNHLNPNELGEGGGTGGYNTDQEIVTGIQPDNGLSASFDRPLYGTVSLRCMDYDNGFTLMTFLGNYDVSPFDGQIAAVLTRNGEVLCVLSTKDGTEAHVDGVIKGISGYKSITMRDIPKNASKDVADGKCEVRLAFRESASSAWQIIRHEHGDAGFIKAEIKSGIITLHTEDTPHPEAAVISPIEPDGEVYAKGSAVFNVTIKNNSSDFNLKNIVTRLTSKDNPEKTWDYENTVNIYDSSTEDVSLLIKLDENMPEGDYSITLFEKEFQDYPFMQTTAENATLKVLPASEVPVMRLTEPVAWRNTSTEENIIRQGDKILFALNTRNYGSAGTVGVVLWFEDSENPERKIMFLQNNIDVKQGETATAQFYRPTFPLDPGTYNIRISYLTSDGQETLDNKEEFTGNITVERSPGEMTLEAVSTNIPDVLYKDEQVPCSITLRSAKDFNGTIYVRLRQFTYTNGELMTIKSASIKAGEEKTVEFKYEPGVDAGNYILIVEAKQGSKDVAISSYNNCYKLITVKDGTSGITAATDNNGDELGIKTYSRGEYAVIENNGKFNIQRVDIIKPDGSQVRSITGKDRSDTTSSLWLGKGLFIVKVITSGGTSTDKIVTK